MVLVVVAPYLRFDTRGGIVGALIRGLSEGVDRSAHTLGLPEDACRQALRGGGVVSDGTGGGWGRGEGKCKDGGGGDAGGGGDSRVSYSSFASALVSASLASTALASLASTSASSAAISDCATGVVLAS